MGSHEAAVGFAGRFATVPVGERFNTVLTSAAGYPLDATYYQTVKGMVGPLEILAPGGDLIVASSCSEGFGSAPFADAQRRLVAHGPERFLEEISSKNHAAIDEWQTEMQLRPMRAGTVHLFTEGLAPEERALTGVRMTVSLSDTVAESAARHGDRRIAVIPEGPYLVPVHRPVQPA